MLRFVRHLYVYASKYLKLIIKLTKIYKILNKIFLLFR